jgi:hypothetical protein
MSFSLNTYVIATSTIAMLGTFLDFFEINLSTITGMVNKGGVKQVSTTETLGGGGRKSNRRKYRKNASKKRR